MSRILDAKRDMDTIKDLRAETARLQEQVETLKGSLILAELERKSAIETAKSAVQESYRAAEYLDRIEALEAERDAARFAERNAESLSSDAIHAIRELLTAHNVPLAAFIDDHVGNAIAQRDAAEADRDRLAADNARLREALDKIAEADFEQSKSELHDFVTDIALAALQKEPQP